MHNLTHTAGNGMVGAVHSIPVGNTVGNTSPSVTRFLNYEKAGP